MYLFQNTQLSHTDNDKLKVLNINPINESYIKWRSIMNIKEALKAGLIGGVISGIISFALNYGVLPMPLDAMQNGIGNGISGLLSGLFSGTVGLLIYMKQQARSAKA